MLPLLLYSLGKKTCPTLKLHILEALPKIATHKVGKALLLPPHVMLVKNVPAVIILSFRTDRSGQTVQTQIRLLLEEQSDKGLHCLLFYLHLFDEKPYVLGFCLNFR